MVGFRCSVFSQASRGRESAGVVARAFQPEHCLAGRAPVVHKTVARAFQPEHCLENRDLFYSVTVVPRHSWTDVRGGLMSLSGWDLVFL